MIRLAAEHIRSAYSSLRRNSSRTLLTVLGITIGVACITSVLMISRSVIDMVSQPIQSLDGNLLIVQPRVPTTESDLLSGAMVREGFNNSTLSADDVAAIRQIEGVRAVAPIAKLSGTLYFEQASVVDRTIVATTSDFDQIVGIELRQGQFLDDDLASNAVVVGDRLAVELFGTDHAVGQVMSVRGVDLTVVGVIHVDQLPNNFNNLDLNQSAIVDFSRADVMNRGRLQIQQIDVLTSGSADQVRQDIYSQVARLHIGEADFEVLSGDEVGSQARQFYQVLTYMMVAVATISLVVGGIGVMNIMLVGVAERTREIGIRKAVGATGGAVMAQFLIESVMMSLLGGLLGYGLGYGITFLVGIFYSFWPVFDWQTAALAAGVSAAVGICFGLFPAARAAYRNVIEALRQYH